MDKQEDFDDALIALWEIRMVAEGGSSDDPPWLMPNKIKHWAELGMGEHRERAQELTAKKVKITVEPLADALARFGWTTNDEFWHRYNTDVWIFNLANAVKKLTEENDRLRKENNGTQRPSTGGD
jgi:hypothetical protein